MSSMYIMFEYYTPKMRMGDFTDLKISQIFILSPPEMSTIEQLSI